MSKKKILAIILICIASFLTGVYVNIHSDVPSTVLSAANIDIRPSGIDALSIELLVNGERTRVQLPTLTHNELLKNSACMKLDDMVEKNYWSHDAPNGTEPWYFFKKAGYRYVNAGENLAYGQSDSGDLVSSWMSSKTHKENILGNYTEFGVCSKVVKYQGSYVNLTVNHFATPF